MRENPKQELHEVIFLQEYLKTGHVSFAIEFVILNCYLQLQRAVSADVIK